MGNAGTHVIGRLRKSFAVPESIAGTFQKPNAIDAVRLLELKMGNATERKPRVDPRATRSLVERITGKGELTWSAMSYLLPSGTAGTPPDVHELLYAAFGSYTNVPATSDTYVPDTSQTVRTLTILGHYEEAWMEHVKGAWVDTCKLSVSGGDDPKLDWAGGAQGYGITGKSTLNGATSGSTFTAQTADSFLYANDGLVKIGTDDNSGAGYLITDDSSRPTFTVDGSPTGVDTDPVVPFVPSETLAGTVTNGITGSITWGGIILPITAFEVELKNNHRGLTDEAFQQFATDVIPSWREVTGNVTFRNRADLQRQIANRLDYDTSRAVTCVIGSGGGKTLTVSMPEVELDFGPLDVPSAEEQVVTLPFVARATSETANDELQFQFT